MTSEEGAFTCFLTGSLSRRRVDHNSLGSLTEREEPNLTPPPSPNPNPRQPETSPSADVCVTEVVVVVVVLVAECQSVCPRYDV